VDKLGILTLSMIGHNSRDSGISVLNTVYSVSQKNPPEVIWIFHFFTNG